MTVLCTGCHFENPAGFRFCGQCGSRLADGLAAPGGADSTAFVRSSGANTSAQAQRRQLTILFCDLVGSTQLSHRLDAEEYHALLMAYRAICVRSIEHYGGSEVRHIGDGTQAYYGYPRAHEDAAERAVLTALDILQAVKQQTRCASWGDAELAVRIGIGTGPVITDPRSAPDGAGIQLTEALGETPNLAARIQSVAPVNGVVIGPLTRELLGNLFTLFDRGEQNFKGIEDPVRVWHVVGIAAVDRFEATRTARAAMVNRHEELSILERSWDRAREGRGNAPMLLGEGGIGKSRLVRALHEQITRHELPFSFFLQCSPIYKNTALYPIITAIESLAGISAGDAPADKVARLSSAWSRSPGADPALLPLLGTLLGLSPDDEPVRDSTDWRDLRERLVGALVEHMQRLSRDRPVLIVVEDLQWIDPSTSELLDRMVRGIADCRVMILGVGRAGVLLPWFGLGHCVTISLEKLSSEDTSELVRMVAGGRRLPSGVAQEIVSKSGGVPLFVEEIVKSLIAGGQLRVKGDAYVLESPLATTAIPPTLTDLLMARLDRAGEGRRYLQVAAVIGSEFTLTLLASVCDDDEAGVELALNALVENGTLGSWISGKGKSYVFNHALMREVVLESMLRTQRQQLHATVAGVLTARFPEIGRVNPEVLARHYSEAASVNEAIEHWLLAGKRASTRSETREAVEHFKSGIAMIPVDDHDDAMTRRHLELLIALGPALIPHAGPGAEEVRETYRRALTLCEALPESAAHFAAYWGWWRISRNFDDKQSAARTLLTLAERLDDPGLMLEAHHALWATTFVLGEQHASLQHVERGLALYEQGDYCSHASIYGGHDAQVCGEGEAALVLWLTGHAEEASRRIERALMLAEQLQHIGSRAHALDYALMLHFYRHDPESVRRRVEEQLSLTADYNLEDYDMRARVFKGWSSALHGEQVGGLQSMRTGVRSQRSTGTTEDFPIFFTMQAEVHLLRAEFEEAAAILAEARNYAGEQKVRLWDAEIHRLQAIVPLMAGRSYNSTQVLEIANEPSAERSEGEAEAHAEQNLRTAAAHLHAALSIARKQGAQMLVFKVVETIMWVFADRDRPIYTLDDWDRLHHAMQAVLRGSEAPDWSDSAWLARVQQAEQHLASVNGSIDGPGDGPNDGPNDGPGEGQSDGPSNSPNNGPNSGPVSDPNDPAGTESRASASAGSDRSNAPA